MRRGAFTLVEIMAVVTLLGLLAGAVAWTGMEDVRRGRRAEVLARVIHADRMARRHASNLTERMVLRIDVDKQSVRRHTVRDRRPVPMGPAVRIPSGARIEEVTLAESPFRSATGRSGMYRRVGKGRVDIPFSSAGRSVSYGVRLTFDGAGDEQRGPIWLVFAGLTGQVTKIHDERQFDNLFQALVSGRPDLD